MSKATFFVLECPTCGRHLEVRVKYLGRLVACRHCRAQFEAFDPDDGRAVAPSDSGLALLARVEELLATADSQKAK